MNKQEKLGEMHILEERNRQRTKEGKGQLRAVQKLRDKHRNEQIPNFNRELEKFLGDATLRKITKTVTIRIKRKTQINSKNEWGRLDYASIRKQTNEIKKKICIDYVIMDQLKMRNV